jgi:hypothetical protein
MRHEGLTAFMMKGSRYVGFGIWLAQPAAEYLRDHD